MWTLSWTGPYIKCRLLSEVGLYLRWAGGPLLAEAGRRLFCKPLLIRHYIYHLYKTHPMGPANIVNQQISNIISLCIRMTGYLLESANIFKTLSKLGAVFG